MLCQLHLYTASETKTEKFGTGSIFMHCAKKKKKKNVSGGWGKGITQHERAWQKQLLGSEVQIMDVQ